MRSRRETTQTPDYLGELEVGIAKEISFELLSKQLVEAARHPVFGRPFHRRNDWDQTVP